MRVRWPARNSLADWWVSHSLNRLVYDGQHWLSDLKRSEWLTYIPDRSRGFHFCYQSSNQNQTSLMKRWVLIESSTFLRPLATVPMSTESHSPQSAVQQNQLEMVGRDQLNPELVRHLLWRSRSPASQSVWKDLAGTRQDSCAFLIMLNAVFRASLLKWA